ncbi:MAG: cation:proton antiporter [Nitrososphaerota archaeon]|nr:cation:proton antiporter [Candidatus Bathyarchaeota archaeon]MDW8048221.1 cation:proton antiporter [Nitrososphaerota archaeon]
MTAGTCSVVIVPLMNKMKVSKEVNTMLSLESVITDILNIVLVITMLHLYVEGLVDIQQTAASMMARFAVGAFLGVLIGLVWLRLVPLIEGQEYTYMFTIALLLFCYTSTEFLGGSGALSALLFGLMLGNWADMLRIFRRPHSNYANSQKNIPRLVRKIKDFQGEMAFLVRAFFFVFLGLIYRPDLYGLLFALLIVAVNLAIRFLSVIGSTFGSAESEHKIFMTLMCGTGLANATLSILTYNTLTSLSLPTQTAYLFPLIVTNIIIVNNILTASAPYILRFLQLR